MDEIEQLIEDYKTTGTVSAPPYITAQLFADPRFQAEYQKHLDAVQV